MCKKRCVSETTKYICEKLPKENSNVRFSSDEIQEKLNAYVYIDSFGRLAVYLKSEEWLGAELEDICGDLAPFCR
jgi:hypothetical protein